MDAQQLAAAIAAAMQQVVAQLPQAQPVQAPVLDRISPFEGGALDLTTRSGQSLYTEGSSELTSKFTGKVEDLFPFLQELKTRARTCYWDQGNHDIVTVNQPDADGNNQPFNLLDQYAKLTATDVENARNAREAGNNVRARQNSRMMFSCIYKSTTEEARARFIADETQMEEDGPTLFYKLVFTTYTSSFSSAQSVRNQLYLFRPKKLKYEIPSINNFIRLAIKKLRASAGTNAAVANPEIFYFQYKIYRHIKSPLEWTNKLLFLENSQAANVNVCTSKDPSSLLFMSTMPQYFLLMRRTYKPSSRNYKRHTFSRMKET